ncbi:MAG: GGDEF domain-containing protein, partial [Phycisphaerae bacterium]|nr:GGDEF domain-containing protein [Phycisphaerae bacterium]
MQTKITIDNQNSDTQILLVGRVENSAIDISGCSGVRFHNCDNLSDAISTAEKEPIQTVAILPEGLDKNLADSLIKLRQINPEAKVFLLTPMWREPEVIKFINTQSNGTRIADDYYLLPTRFCAKQSKETGKTPTGTLTSVPAPEISAAATVSDISIIEQQQQRIEILEKLVMEDELTGIKNRRFVREFLRQIIARADKESLQVTLLVFDIDNFKHYNDLFGHPVGDNILKQVALLLQKCCRKQDVVGRVGGDEFAVVFWNIKPGSAIELEEERRTVASEHPKQVISICQRFRNEINNTNLPALGAEGKGILAISGGLATFPRDGSTV